MVIWMPSQSCSSSFCIFALCLFVLLSFCISDVSFSVLVKYFIVYIISSWFIAIHLVAFWSLASWFRVISEGLDRMDGLQRTSASTLNGNNILQTHKQSAWKPLVRANILSPAPMPQTGLCLVGVLPLLLNTLCALCAHIAPIMCAYYVHTVRTMCALCAHTNLSCLTFACIVCILHTLCEHDGIPFVLYSLVTCTHMCVCIVHFVCILLSLPLLFNTTL